VEGDSPNLRLADFSGRIAGWNWGSLFSDDLQEDGKRLVKIGGRPPGLVASWQVTGVTHEGENMLPPSTKEHDHHPGER